MHCYVGDGLKAPTRTYYPLDVPKIYTEPDDPVGQPEPTPLEAPPVVAEEVGEED